jgi:hypothetical protein
MLSELFHAMANQNGRFGKAAIPWFNGGLFDDDDVLPLGIVAVRDLMIAARLDFDTQSNLNGQVAPRIHSDLSRGATNLTSALRLEENVGVRNNETSFGTFPFPEGLPPTSPPPSMPTPRGPSQSLKRRGGSMSFGRRG